LGVVIGSGDDVGGWEELGDIYIWWDGRTQAVDIIFGILGMVNILCMWHSWHGEYSVYVAFLAWRIFCICGILGMANILCIRHSSAKK